MNTRNLSTKEVKYFDSIQEESFLEHLGANIFEVDEADQIFGRVKLPLGTTVLLWEDEEGRTRGQAQFWPQGR